jgi:hypothetical protein
LHRQQWGLVTLLAKVEFSSHVGVRRRLSLSSSVLLLLLLLLLPLLPS